MPPTHETTPTVTEKAQDKRREVILFTTDGIPGTVTFPDEEFRQAWSVAEEMTTGMDENDMGVLMYSEGNWKVVSVFPRIAGDIDLLCLIDNRENQAQILSQWYKDLYPTVQAGLLAGSSQHAYLILEEMLAPLGIDPSGESEKPPHMFKGYSSNDPVMRSYQTLKTTIENTIQATTIKKGISPSLGFAQSQEIALHLWNLIGLVRPSTQTDLEHDFAYANLASCLPGAPHFDAGP